MAKQILSCKGFHSPTSPTKLPRSSRSTATGTACAWHWSPRCQGWPMKWPLLERTFLPEMWVSNWLSMRPGRLGTAWSQVPAFSYDVIMKFWVIPDLGDILEQGAKVAKLKLGMVSTLGIMRRTKMYSVQKDAGKCHDYSEAKNSQQKCYLNNFTKKDYMEAQCKNNATGVPCSVPQAETLLKEIANRYHMAISISYTIILIPLTEPTLTNVWQKKLITAWTSKWAQTP